MAVPVFADIDKNSAYLRARFHPCSDLTAYRWHYGPGLRLKAMSFYLDTLVLDKRTNYFKQMLQDLVQHEVGDGSEVTLEMIVKRFGNHVGSEESGLVIDSLEEAEQFILSGCLIIFIDGWNHAISFHPGRFETRQVSEPVTEPVVQGPRESTVENLKKNIGMIRARVQNSSVKFNFLQTGGPIAHGHRIRLHGRHRGAASAGRVRVADRTPARRRRAGDELYRGCTRRTHAGRLSRSSATRSARTSPPPPC